MILVLHFPAAQHHPQYHHSSRNGERKRIYDLPTPEHYFHLQYQLLPGGREEGRGEGRGGVSKSDVVTFGVVSKVYTENDCRVVRCWEEEEEEEREGEDVGREGSSGDRAEESAQVAKRKRSHFGWRHK